MDWIQLGTLLFLAAAAGFAGWQVMEAREDRRQRHRPFVVLDFEPTATIFAELVVRNIGTTPAREVVARLNEPPEVALEGGPWPALDAALFSDGIPLMPPGRDVRMLFDRVPDRVKRDLAMSWTATVTYRDDRGNNYTETYPLDLNAWIGYSSIHRKGLHETAEELEKIRNALERA